MSATKASLVTAPLRADQEIKKANGLAVHAEDSCSQWLSLAALAFIYGAAVMAIVIVTLIKSARKRNADARRRR